MTRYREWFRLSFYESRSDSVIARKESEFRTISIRESVRRGRHNISSILGAFSSRRRFSRDIPIGATIHYLDLQTFFSKDLKQQRVDTMLKKDMWWAIGWWFYFSHIPTNAAGNTHYRSAISAIQAIGPGVDPPTPRDIYDQLLDSNKKYLERWIFFYKNKWTIYELMVMCDGWTSLTRWSIINFVIYYDGKIFFINQLML